MENIILTLDQHELDPSITVGNRNSYFVRRAARAVLINSDGQVALMHAKQRDYYKLPGGGIDEGESIKVALTRELLEEAGATGEVLRELGTVIEWRDFTSMKHVSYAFEVTLKSQLASPDLTESEINEGFELVWVKSLDEAIRLVEHRADSDDLSVAFMTRRDGAILRAARS